LEASPPSFSYENAERQNCAPGSVIQSTPAPSRRAAIGGVPRPGSKDGHSESMGYGSGPCLLAIRPADIPILARHFTQKYASKMGRQIESIPSDTMLALVS
jgi:hypothetical protein